MKLATRGALCALALFSGCWSQGPAGVVVYSALDREFSEPVLERFERQHSIDVLPKYDIESTKTVGLVNAILAERQNPRCDLFWNNEILHTIRLDRAGLLAPLPSQALRPFPNAFRSPRGTWCGFAARARVLLVNTQRLTKAEYPTSVEDLVADRFVDQAAIAKPLFGTTATHAAVLFALWGPDRATEFFGQVHERCQIVGGNRQVAAAVAKGQVAFGLTDTDDALIEIAAGAPVEIVYPDQGEAETGTLFIPNTIALIRGSSGSAAAERLAAFLLAPEVEIELARGPSGQIPLHRDVDIETQVATPRRIRAMEVDFERAADAWPEAARLLQATFQRD